MRRKWLIPVVLVLVVVAGCDEFTLYDYYAGEDDAPLSISPTNTAVYTGAEVVFSADGGNPSYEFALISGIGRIDSKTGVYAAPLTLGDGVVRVTDKIGSTADARVSVVAPTALELSPTSLIININESYQFTVEGGLPGYTFEIDERTGGITTDGVYTAPANPAIETVRVTDSDNNSLTASVSVVDGTSGLGIYPTGPAIPENETLDFSGYGGNMSYTYSSTFTGSIDNTGLFTADSSMPLGTHLEAVTVDDASATTVKTDIVIILATPTDLVADGTYPGPAAIRLTWTDNSSREAGYIIERKVAGDASFTQVGSVAADVTTYDDKKLTEGTLYVYRVRADAGSGNESLDSQPSNEDFDYSNS